MVAYTLIIISDRQLYSNQILIITVKFLKIPLSSQTMKQSAGAEDNPFNQKQINNLNSEINKPSKNSSFTLCEKYNSSLNEKLKSRTTSRHSIFSPRSPSQNRQFFQLPISNQFNNNQILSIPISLQPILESSQQSSGLNNRIFNGQGINQNVSSGRHQNSQNRNRRCKCRFSLENILTHPIVLYSVLVLIFAGIIFGIACFGAGMVKMYGFSQNNLLGSVQVNNEYLRKLNQRKYDQNIQIINSSHRYTNPIDLEQFSNQFHKYFNMNKYRMNKE